MKSYFILEMKRTLNLKNGMFLMIMLFLAVLMLFLINTDLSEKETHYIDTKIRYTEEMAIKNKEVLISSYEKNILDFENDNGNSLKKILNMEQTFSTQELHVYQQFKKKYWTPYLNRENIYISKIDFSNQKGLLFPEDYREMVQAKIFLNTELIKNNFPYQSTRYGVYNYLFLYSLLSHLCSPLGIAIYLLFFGSVHFKSFNNKKIKLAITMPISRMSILISNTLIFLFRIVCITLIICLFAFTIASIGRGKVSYDYPIITFNQGIQLIPIYYFILKILCSFFLIMIFSFVFCQFIVLLTKTDFMAILLSTLIIVSFAYTLQIKVNSTHAISAFLPFTYATPSRIISGESKEDIILFGHSDINGYPNTAILENQGYYVGDSLSKRNPYISDGLGAIVVTSWTMITLGLSCLIIKKRTF